MEDATPRPKVLLEPKTVAGMAMGVIISADRFSRDDLVWWLPPPQPRSGAA